MGDKLINQPPQGLHIGRISVLGRKLLIRARIGEINFRRIQVRIGDEHVGGFEISVRTPAILVQFLKTSDDAANE